MGAIAIHHTATDDKSSWDGPAEVAAAPNEPKVLHYMHAWVDSKAPDTLKSAYKFPHHKNGTDTAANIHGVNNALARLSRTDIPAGDKTGVEDHLRAHRKDAGLEDHLSQDELLAATRHIAKTEDLTTEEKRALIAAVQEQEQPVPIHLPAQVQHAPIRCFDGKAQPHEPFWTLRNAAETESGEPEVEFYGPISEFIWLGDEITPKLFKDDLYKLGNKGSVTVRLNSPGGDLIAASVIRAIMLDYPGRITVKIDGIAASAAVLVALGGDTVKIQQTAYMMIHDPMVVLFLAALNIQDLADLLGELKTVKAGIIDAYETKTQLAPEKISKMMSATTWMTASESVAFGFADEVITGKARPVNIVGLQNYGPIPPALLDQSRMGEQNLANDVEKAREAQRLRDEIQKYL